MQIIGNKKQKFNYLHGIIDYFSYLCILIINH